MILDFKLLAFLLGNYNNFSGVKSSSRHRDNLTRGEREALRTLRKNTDLTILPADKGNATWILNIVDYRRSPPFLRIHHTDDWPGILLIRQNKKTTLPLKKNPLSQKIYANNCVRPAPDPETVRTSEDA
jgi:hypothetical protein